MNRRVRWLAIGALSVGTVGLMACGQELQDGTGSGGSGSTSSNASTSSGSMTTGSSTATSSATGGIGPCVLDSSNIDECMLQ